MPAADERAEGQKKKIVLLYIKVRQHNIGIYSRSVLKQ